ncbi:putative septation protein SUN4 precursor [Cladorrhinum samala]|uniref:Septation protein SUN4 n=1 Tax=Cladorrhinum samala TaxID=585594 RepID=A0AAV9HJW0_9PEZI|nr:putative septation protein SUN4 precursor [Cladorrhinum samala]
MKGVLKSAVAAALVAGAVAQPHNHGHGHLHRHAKKHDQVEKREKVVVTHVVPTYVVKYVLDGQDVSPEDAEKGIKGGNFVVVGSSKPSMDAELPAITTTIAPPHRGGQFLEKATSTTSSTTSSTPEPEQTSSSSEAPAPSIKSQPKPVSAGAGIDSDFPSGEIPCSEVPTAYGAIAIPWSKTNGWTTLAKFGKWVKGVKVNNIVTPIDGTCQEEMMCSYACPPGYQKTQWPENEQGATGQSVGGLWCNADGFLELTRPEHPKLCEKGAGGVFVRNELGGNAAVCRTDYPGNENMIIPLDTYPGQTYPLTNPDSSTYYFWQGKPTTAQYYVNNENVAVEDACVWKSDKFPDSAGNWAPTNIGVGKSLTGETFISIFPNLPTTTAILGFDIEITGDISGTCTLKSGVYSGNNGCTVALRAGGTATIVFKKSS